MLYHLLFFLFNMQQHLPLFEKGMPVVHKIIKKKLMNLPTTSFSTPRTPKIDRTLGDFTVPDTGISPVKQEMPPEPVARLYGSHTY